MIDVLSYSLGVVTGIVLVAAAALWRASNPSPARASTTPMVRYECKPCEEPFESLTDAIDHAKATHKAPDDKTALTIIEKVDHDSRN